MHEYSVVMSMVDVCEKSSKGKKISKVVANIGKMSGVEPPFLKESFDVFKEGTLCEEATLEMNIIDITIQCNDCKKEALVDSYNFYCPYCKSGDTKVLTGQEMHIDYIELKDE